MLGQVSQVGTSTGGSTDMYSAMLLMVMLPGLMGGA
jgi:hypothetical protein